LLTSGNGEDAADIAKPFLEQYRDQGQSPTSRVWVPLGVAADDRRIVG